MSLTARLWTPRPRADSTLERLILDTYGGNKTASGQSVTPDRAMRASAVYTCVLVLSQSLAQMPLHLYRQTGRQKEFATDLPLYALTHDQPNAWMTSFQFKELVMVHILLRGNSVWLKTRDTRGQLRELIPISPDRVAGIQQDERYRLVYKIRRPGPGGIVDDIPGEAVLHFRYLSLDGIRGVSPIEYAREMIGLSLAMERHGATVFSNGAALGGILLYPGKLTDKAKKNLEESFNEKYGAIAGAHKTAVLEEGMKWEKVAMTAEDAQFIESAKFQRSQICGFFRVPAHLANDLEKATFCLPAGELVSTTAGPLPIESVLPGALVWSRTGDGKLAPARVLASRQTGSDRILTIRTTNRVLRCNGRHPVLVRRKYKRGRVVEWRSEYVKASDLVIGDAIVTLAGLPADFGSVDGCPTRRPSIGFMEFCGLLLGDGNVSKSGSSRYIVIARGQNAEYMGHYRRVITDEFESFGWRGNGRNREVPRGPVKLQEAERYTRFSSVLAAEELSVLGLGGTALTKSVPAWVFQAPEEHRLAFLRGFLDADGSVDKMGRISFASANPSMLQQIRHLCVSCGVPVTNLRMQSGVVKLPNGKLRDFEAYTFTASDPASNLRIGTHTPVYLARMRKGKPFGRKERKYPLFGGRGFAEPGLSLARVNRITAGPAEPVFDLEVEGSHSFIASGVVVHNSNIENLDIGFTKHTMTPLAVSFEQTLKRDLLSDAEKVDLYWKFAMEGLLRGDTASRTAYFNAGVMNGWLNANEARELDDRNPYPEGDVFRVPVNTAPADAAQQQPGGQPAPSPAQGA